MNKEYNGFVFKSKESTGQRARAEPSAKKEKEKPAGRARSESVGFSFRMKSGAASAAKPWAAAKSARKPAEARASKSEEKKESAPEKFVFKFGMGRAVKASEKQAPRKEAPVEAKPSASARGKKLAKKPAAKKSILAKKAQATACEAQSLDKALPAGSREKAVESAEMQVDPTTPKRPETTPEEMHALPEAPEGAEKEQALRQRGGRETLEGVRPSVIRSIETQNEKGLEALPAENGGAEEAGLGMAVSISPIKRPGSSTSVLSVTSANGSSLDAIASTPLVNKKRMTIGPYDLLSPVKIRRLSLDVFDTKKKSVFQTRRESLFGYDQLYSGSVSPEDFYRHSNASQPAKTRIKQVLLWISKYISNGHVCVEGVSPEALREICAMYMKKVGSLVIPEREKKKENAHIVENANTAIQALRMDMCRSNAEIEKWKTIYSSMLAQYSIAVPLHMPEESLRRLSIRRQSFNGLVSFDATVVDASPIDIKRILARNLEELHSALNSSRYFMFLSLEYTKRVCGSLLEASHPLDKSKANALLHVLCRISRKARV
ncbi:uncharacterized protein NEMAJ01_1297 [Nematocida major]|uniref:uncharacterized protein n=1 Tax=Nematocida major TaxID=1912982 RepID=UPI0020086F30|nr:uncharacterized protein NEMAJ01_1297 [Nematocida major]KAH9386401.1 hypothetical protein NEMAJ01_1297 [Nematocida major]